MLTLSAERAPQSTGVLQIVPHVLKAVVLDQAADIIERGQRAVLPRLFVIGDTQVGAQRVTLHMGLLAYLERYHLRELDQQRATRHRRVGRKNSLVVVHNEQVAQRAMNEIETDVGVEQLADGIVL